ncbi:MAG: phosphatase PAP2 family protein [Dehalococcoidia bacterium]
MSPRVTVFVALLWLTLLSLSLILTALAAGHDPLPGDTGIASWAQDLFFPGQVLADAVRSITSTQVVLAGGGALALVLWLRGYRRHALIFAAGLVILPLLQYGIKEIVDRPRPSEDIVELRASFTSPSFPSGHVMSSVYLYGFLLYLGLVLPLATTARAALVAISGAVLALSGPTNVWLGIHWPSDILGGYAWGIVLLLPVAMGCWPKLRHH